MKVLHNLFLLGLRIKFRERTKQVLIYGICFSIIQCQVSCKKFLSIKAPYTSITSENVYGDDQTAAAVLTGLYATLSSPGLTTNGFHSISLTAGLSADELSLQGGNAAIAEFYNNALSTTTNRTSWENIYSLIYTVNIALEKLANSESLNPQVRRQLIGESKFIRALSYFYLLNLFGDVPLTTTSDYRYNSKVSRNSKTDVYKQIILDLSEAYNELNSNFLDASLLTNTTERVRPTKWAAIALLARVYLYLQDWRKAEEYSSLVIGESSTFKLTSLDSTFLKNSKEAIWQLQPVNSGWNTENGRAFILPVGGPSNSNPVFIGSNLLNSFEEGDKRRYGKYWIDSVKIGTSNPSVYYYSYKYKIGTYGNNVVEYEMVLRLGEQYLIRAEARARLGDLPGAVVDLNTIRIRAGLTAYGGPASQAPVLSAIMHERQLELFTEWGHRWLDLKRTGAIDAVMNVVSTSKGRPWYTNMQLYPLPAYEIEQNPNLDQNPGY